MSTCQVCNIKIKKQKILLCSDCKIKTRVEYDNLKREAGEYYHKNNHFQIILEDESLE